MSYVEIYNENIRDLLSGSDEYLDLREDPIKARGGQGQLQQAAAQRHWLRP